MPDISMCFNEKCEKRHTCYRFIATPNKFWQSYGTFSPDKNGNCDYYWKVEKDKSDETKTTK